MLKRMQLTLSFTLTCPPSPALQRIIKVTHVLQIINSLNHPKKGVNMIFGFKGGGCSLTCTHYVIVIFIHYPGRILESET